MIINLRGTSGSGKSTIVRRVMDYYYQPAEPHFIQGRKRPIGYRLKQEHVRDLWVVGHYETPCGGCDTILKIDDVYAEVRRADDAGLDVLYEGLLVMSDLTRCIALKQEGRPIEVVFLDVPLDVCVASVQQRRTARGDLRPLDPTNTASKMKMVPRSMQRFQDAGVRQHLLSRDQALAYCLFAFGLQPVGAP